MLEKLLKMSASVLVSVASAQVVPLDCSCSLVVNNPSQTKLNIGTVTVTSTCTVNPSSNTCSMTGTATITYNPGLGVILVQAGWGEPQTLVTPTPGVPFTGTPNSVKSCSGGFGTGLAATAWINVSLGGALDGVRAERKHACIAL